MASCVAVLPFLWYILSISPCLFVYCLQVHVTIGPKTRRNARRLTPCRAAYEAAGFKNAGRCETVERFFILRTQQRRAINKISRS